MGCGWVEVRLGWGWGEGEGEGEGFGLRAHQPLRVPVERVALKT